MVVVGLRAHGDNAVVLGKARRGSRSGVLVSQAVRPVVRRREGRGSEEAARSDGKRRETRMAICEQFGTVSPRSINVNVGT